MGGTSYKMIRFVFRPGRNKLLDDSITLPPWKEPAKGTSYWMIRLDFRTVSPGGTRSEGRPRSQVSNTTVVQHVATILPVNTLSKLFLLIGESNTKISAPQAVPPHDTIGHAKLNNPLPSRFLIRGRASSQ